MTTTNYKEGDLVTIREYSSGERALQRKLLPKEYPVKSCPPYELTGCLFVVREIASDGYFLGARCMRSTKVLLGSRFGPVTDDDLLPRSAVPDEVSDRYVIMNGVRLGMTEEEYQNLMKWANDHKVPEQE